MEGFIFRDDGEQWLVEILTNHREEARARAFELLEQAEALPNGCIVTNTTALRKVRFKGRQVSAYRFIYCVLHETVASFDQVVRHRCHERRCINPKHLTIGSRADNKHDDWEAEAYGIDRSLL